MGLLAGFFGVGGGFLVVPALLFLTGMPILNAIGSSLVAVGSLGLTTALSYTTAHLYERVVNVQGGTMAWMRQSLPLG